MAEPPDAADLTERLTRMGAAVAERRNELSQTRDRIDRLRALVDAALEVHVPRVSPAMPSQEEPPSQGLRLLLAERDERLRAARGELTRMEADLARLSDRLDHERDARRRTRMQMEQRVVRAEAELSTMTANALALSRELADTHDQLARAQRAVNERNEHVRAADARIREADAAREAAERRYQTSRQGLVEAVAARAEAWRRRDEALRATAVARQVADSAAASADLAVSAADAGRERAERLEARLLASQAELRRAEQLLNTRTEELAAVRREMDRARRGRSAAPRWAATRPPAEALPARQGSADALPAGQGSAEGLPAGGSSAAAPSRPRRAYSRDMETARVRELEQQLSLLVHGLATTRSDLERVQSSTAWRFGHAVTTALMRLRGRRPKTRGAVAAALARIDRLEEEHSALGGSVLRAAALRRLPRAPEPPPGPRALLLPPGSRERDPAERQALAEEIRRRLGPLPELPEPPLVSVVVPNRNGRPLLESLVEGLANATDYPTLELVVVDNASSDDSVAYLEGVEAGFPVRVLANDTNLSFSEACNHGAADAAGDLLLFLNNDIQPFEAGWLRELVGVVRRDDVVACGPALIYGQDRQDPERTGWLIQHRGIRFGYEGHDLKAFNVDDGAQLFDDAFGIEHRCPALTGACLLVERAAFHEVGGFSPGYHYGTEDVDLGMKLRRTGRELVATGRAVLFHQHSATQAQINEDIGRMHRRANLKLFHERWGPAVRRGVRIGSLDTDPYWGGDRSPHIGITLTSLEGEFRAGDWYTAHEIGEALARRFGWRVSYLQREDDDWYRLPEDLDYVLVTMDSFDARHVPPGLTVIAWIRNWTERWLERPWFSRVDVVLASSRRSAELVEEATGRSAISFPLATNPVRFSPRPAVPEFESDYVFTGNYWRADRAIEAALDPRREERLLLFGHRWNEVKRMRPYARGPIEYDRLADVYVSTKLVIDDTAGPTLPYGALNGRVFDALACGRIALTNCEAGVRELFDDEYPTWNSRETLRERLDELLADKERREELAERYRAIVLERHTYDHRADELVRILRDRERVLSFCLKIGAPNWGAAERWGDLYFARALEAELKRRGHPCRIQVLDEWEDLDGLGDDVVIHLRGLSRYRPKPGQLNVLWSISHPQDLSADECDTYDLVFVASSHFAEQLRPQTRAKVLMLEQATDPRVFYPEADPSRAHELVFVGNSRNVLRRIVRDVLPTDHDFAVYGGNWDGLIDDRLVAADFVANEELRKVYSSAAIVLADHWDDMRVHGYVSNRIFDALACGALVISDDVPGLEDRFGGGVLTYATPDGLHELIERMLAAPEERSQRAAAGRSIVLAEHTFAQRVDALLAEVERAHDSVPTFAAPARA